MRVKALFLVSLVLASWVAGVARAQFQHNFLAGGEIGVESRRSEFVSRYQVSPSALVSVPQSALLNVNSTRVADSGSFMGLLGGWQFQCNRWLGGIEANIDFQSFEEKKEFLISDVLQGTVGGVLLGPTSAFVKYDRGTRYSGYLRAGYWITPFFLGYVKGGVQYSRDELTLTIPTRQIAAAFGAIGASSPGEPPISVKDDIWGAMGGIGLEFPVFGPSSVRVEYNYVRTEKFLVSDASGVMTGTHRVRSPESHIGKVAWVWNFA